MINRVIKVTTMIVVLFQMFGQTWGNHHEANSNGSYQITAYGARFIQWHPNGEWLAILVDEDIDILTAGDESIEIYSLVTNQLAFELPLPAGQIATKMVWSQDGSKLALATLQTDGSLRSLYVWNTINPAMPIPIHTLPETFQSVEGIAWSYDGNQIAVNNYDVVEVRDIVTGENLFSIESHAAPFYLPQLAWNSTHLAAASDKDVYIWDTSAGNTLLGKLSATMSIFDIVWNPNAFQIAVADGFEIKVWEWDTIGGIYEMVTSLEVSDYVRGLDWKGDRLVNLSRDNQLYIWDTTVWELLNIIPSSNIPETRTAISLSPDGKRVAYVDATGSLAFAHTCRQISNAITLVSIIEMANLNGSPIEFCLVENDYLMPEMLPTITGDITIEGNGATLTHDPSAELFRFFEIAPGGSLTLNNLTLSNGKVDAQGGAVYNNGTLTLSNVTFRNNGTHHAPDSGAAEGVGCEGAIYTTPTGSLTINGIICTSPLP